MIITASYDRDGRFAKAERFVPTLPVSHPIDMAFGPNGDLYVLEYGQGWFLKRMTRRVRIEYNAGNRKPSVEISANQHAGAVPLKVAFSSKGTKDFDGDALSYQWKISRRSDNSTARAKADRAPLVLKEANPTFTFQQPGQYRAVLTVMDAQGLSTTRERAILAGNQSPTVDIAITQGNRSFYFPGHDWLSNQRYR